MSSRVREPIAVVGVAGIYPGAADLESFWSALVGGARPPMDAPSPRWSFDPASSDPAAEDRGVARGGAFLPDVEINVARFGIPPAQTASVARAQLLFLEVAHRCLTDAGAAERDLPRDRTDVICGSCFGFDRTYANALRVEAGKVIARFVEALPELAPNVAGSEPERQRVAKDLKERYRAKLGGAAHDRIGEMASTIPARISIAHKLRGRCMTVESADATAFVALRAAMTNLRRREADLALVVVGQVWDSPLASIALSKKGYLSPGAAIPFSRESRGFTLGEGVGAVLLARLDDALAGGYRVDAVLSGAALTHSSKRGAFRYSTSVAERSAAMRRACAEAGWEPSSIQLVECAATGLPGETELEIEALSGALAEDGATRQGVLLGSVKEATGHTWANAGLAGLTKVILSLRNRTIAPQAGLRGGETMDLSRTQLVVAEKARPWPENAGGLPRRAAVSGGSFTGTSCVLLVEEYLRGRPSIEGGTPPRAPIAIVGSGGVFPDAASAKAFWANIASKHDALRELPDRVVERAVYHSPGNLDVFKTYSIVGAKIDTPPLDGFKLLPRRVAYMDDAQKLALIAARGALEPLAGRMPDRNALVVMASSLCLNAERAANTRVELHRLESVLEESPAFRAMNRVAQARFLDYLRQSVRDAVPPISSWSLDGYLASGIAAAISNELELNAVPVAVEAACASSMAALDLAVQALGDHQYDFAIAGGVELPANARDLVICASLGLLSPDRITPFDARADGFSVGDGIALFALERLPDAIASGHPIQAVIRAVGSASDARSLIAPDAEGQALAMKRAFEKVDFGPGTIQYIETHGTGTSIGDVVEVNAIREVYKNGPRPVPLALGSVKSMIGHTFAAAGAAGLLKTVLALGEQEIPPNIALEKLNPKLDLESIPAFVSTERAPWPKPNGAPRRAAVSAMGTGGINYHVLVEEAPGAGRERS